MICNQGFNKLLKTIFVFYASPSCLKCAFVLKITWQNGLNWFLTTFSLSLTIKIGDLWLTINSGVT